MKRPRHVWLVFTIGLMLAVAGMVWLSATVSELERSKEDGIRQGMFEKQVGDALFRMDSYLNELFREQSAWPYVAYQPTYSMASSGKKVVENPSPLRVPGSPLVKLYFQVTPEKTYTSPGVPRRGSRPAKGATELSAAQVAGNTRLLSEISQLADPKLLMAQCAPPKPVTEETIAALAEPQSQAYGGNEAYAAPSDKPVPQRAAEEIAQNAQPAQGQSRSLQEYNTLKNRYVSQAENWNVQSQLRLQLNNQLDSTDASASPEVVEGPSRPLWLGDELILARRVKVGDATVLQGCWFDWSAVKQALRSEVAHLTLMRDIDVLPVVNEGNESTARMLATLPARLVASPAPLPPAAAGMTPVRLSLLLAWIALTAAALAAALLLRGVMALSERRAAFVSAVTHELRTPLTTFRMYSEMLAEGMVADQNQQRHYLGTLKNEADRLFHLIENVLSYARLERGRQTGVRTTATVEHLLAPMISRLAERTSRSLMELVFELDPDVAESSIETDPGALEQILDNLVDNACKYAASATDRRIHLIVQRQRQWLALSVSDHGPGISAAEGRRLFRPFTKSASQAAQTAPGVGLGLALSQRLARDLGGSLELIQPEEERLGAEFRLKVTLG